MAFSGVKNLFTSLFSFLSCVSKSTASDGERERFPPALRSVPPQRDTAGSARQNVTGTSTGNPADDVPPKSKNVLSATADDEVSVPQDPLTPSDQQTPSPSPGSVPNTAAEDVICPQTSCTSLVSEDALPTPTQQPSTPESGGTSLTTSSSVSTNVGSPKNATVEESEQVRPDDTPVLSHSASGIAVDEAADLQTSLISAGNSPSVICAPEIGCTPVTVPGSVSDKLHSIMNLATANTPKKIAADEHDRLPLSESDKPALPREPSFVRQSSSTDVHVPTVTVPVGVNGELESLLSAHPHRKEEKLTVYKSKKLPHPSTTPRLQQCTDLCSSCPTKSPCRPGLERCDLSTTVTSASSVPETGFIPVTVPSNVTDKLWQILNMAATKPSCEAGKEC